jgi:hypothetical protein
MPASGEKGASGPPGPASRGRPPGCSWGDVPGAGPRLAFPWTGLLVPGSPGGAEAVAVIPDAGIRAGLPLSPATGTSPMK